MSLQTRLAALITAIGGDIKLIQSKTVSSVQTVATTDGAMVIGSHNPVDATSGLREMTVADAPGAGYLISMEKEDNTTNAVHVTLNLRGAASAVQLDMYRQGVQLLSGPDGTWWPINPMGLLTGLDQRWATQAQIDHTDAVIRFTDIPSLPARSTVTTNTTTRRVRWAGPVQPTAGGIYAVAGLDVWERTA